MLNEQSFQFSPEPLVLTEDHHVDPAGPGLDGCRGSGSQLSGDSGEGAEGAGGLQLQGGQEAVGGLAAAQSLQGLTQAAPRFMRGAVDLHRIPQNLLSQVDTPSSDQQTALKET